MRCMILEVARTGRHLLPLLVFAAVSPSVACGGSDNGTYAYYYAHADRIYQVPAGGGIPVILASSSNGHELGRALAFDAKDVYYSDEVGTPPVSSLLVRPRAGGTSSPIASGLDAVPAIASAGDDVFFTDWAFFAAVPSGFIGRVSRSGGAVQRLAELTDPAAIPSGLAVFAGYVYWTQTDGAVLRVPAAGGSAETLASGEVAPAGIAVNASGATWLDAGHWGIDCTPTDGQVRRLPAGADAPVTLAAGLEGAFSLSLADTAIFWTTEGLVCNGIGQGRGSVFELAAGAAEPQPRSTGQWAPSNLFVDGTTVYFTTLVDANTNTVAPVALPR